VTAYLVAVAADPIEAAIAAACIAATDAVIASLVGELGLRGMLLDPALIRSTVRADLDHWRNQ
jgi:hypothetical protein